MLKDGVTTETRGADEESTAKAQYIRRKKCLLLVTLWQSHRLEVPVLKSISRTGQVQ